MEVLYEECAHNQKAKKQSVFYVIANVVFWLSIFAAIITTINALLYIPSPELTGDELAAMWLLFASQWIPVALSVSLGFFAWFIKRRVNVSYDYAFVSGDLRISRIFNVNKRKFLYEITAEEIMQVGDADSQNFERLSSDPTIKTFVCTSNMSPAEDKFFMYILVKAGAQRQLYVLECREELLINILKFARRGVLEDGYVSQEDKKAAIKKEEEKQRLLQEQEQVKEPQLSAADEQELAALRAASMTKTEEVAGDGKEEA